uniref:Uncharacterized protein n=1 Tax=Arundo donax TaxID=35708 RepID=A0A0A8ZU09_ARUDO
MHRVRLVGQYLGVDQGSQNRLVFCPTHLQEQNHWMQICAAAREVLCGRFFDMAQDDHDNMFILCSSDDDAIRLASSLYVLITI